MQSSSWTEEGFAEEYEVSYDDEGKISEIVNKAERAAKEAYDAKTPEQKKAFDTIIGVMAKVMPQLLANEIVGRVVPNDVRTPVQQEMLDTYQNAIREMREKVGDTDENHANLLSDVLQCLCAKSSKLLRNDI